MNLPIDQLEPYLEAKLLTDEKALLLDRIKERIEKEFLWRTLLMKLGCRVTVLC